jgi:hypothetical protein
MFDFLIIVTWEIIANQVTILGKSEKKKCCQFKCHLESHFGYFTCFYFWVSLLGNQDQLSINTQICLLFEYCYSENRVKPSINTLEVQTCEEAKMTLRVTILSHVWFSEYGYPENLAYLSNDIWLTLIFQVLLLRKYFLCKTMKMTFLKGHKHEIFEHLFFSWINST